MMCHIITHVLEFNNWEAMADMIIFAKERYGNCYPFFDIEVPWRIKGGVGWDWLDSIARRMMEEAPDDLTEMSVYGKIWFEVTTDYTRTPEEIETLKYPVDQ